MRRLSRPRAPERTNGEASFLYTLKFATITTKQADSEHLQDQVHKAAVWMRRRVTWQTRLLLNLKSMKYEYVCDEHFTFRDQTREAFNSRDMTEDHGLFRRAKKMAFTLQ